MVSQVDIVQSFLSKAAPEARQQSVVSAPSLSRELLQLQGPNIWLFPPRLKPKHCQSHSRNRVSHTSFAPLATLHCVIFTGYIGEFEIIDDHRSQKIVIELTGRLNKCGVISPRFDVEVGELEKWVVNLLPSRQFGHIILSTTYGIMTHEEARRKKTGGKILGFFY